MTQTIRSELRLMEQSINQSWQIDDRAFTIGPNEMLKIIATGTNREKTAAMRVLAALNAQNKPSVFGATDPSALHLHQHSHSDLVSLTIDQRKQRNAERLDRIKRLGN